MQSTTFPPPPPPLMPETPTLREAVAAAMGISLAPNVFGVDHEDGQPDHENDDAVKRVDELVAAFEETAARQARAMIPAPVTDADIESAVNWAIEKGRIKIPKPEPPPSHTGWKFVTVMTLLLTIGAYGISFLMYNSLADWASENFATVKALDAKANATDVGNLSSLIDLKANATDVDARFAAITAANAEPIATTDGDGDSLDAKAWSGTLPTIDKDKPSGTVEVAMPDGSKLSCTYQLTEDKSDYADLSACATK